MEAQTRKHERKAHTAKPPRERRRGVLCRQHTYPCSDRRKTQCNMMMIDGLLLLQFPYTHSPAAADPLSLNPPASKPQRSSKQAAGDDHPVSWNPKASWLLGRRGGNEGGRLTCMYCCWWLITQSAGCEWAPTIQRRLVFCCCLDIMSELDCGYNNPLLRHNRRGDLVVSSSSVQQTWRELWLHSAYLTLLISTVRSFSLSLCLSLCLAWTL